MVITEQQLRDAIIMLDQQSGGAGAHRHRSFDWRRALAVAIGQRPPG